MDDTPYGGGAGMVLMCQPILDALESIRTENSTVILLTPQGKTFNQSIAKELSLKEHLIFICGHYEGFDERIRDYVDIQMSLGDFVLTGVKVHVWSCAIAYYVFYRVLFAKIPVMMILSQMDF